MNAKGLMGLIVATVVVAILAALALNRDSATDAATGGAERGSLFCTGLLDEVNDVARIEITRGDEAFAIQRTGDVWGLEERDGFPVKIDTVKQTIVGLADLAVVEAKTKNPSYHDRLGLGDPADPTGEAKRVALKDASGNVLADVVLGTAKPGTQPSLYVRRSDEDQTWECAGRMNVSVDPLSWIERKVAQIDRERIASATLHHTDGETVSVARETPEDGDYELLELPPGRDLKAPTETAGLATWLTYLSLEDVRSVDEVDFAAEPVAMLETRTFDGLVVKVETAEADGRNWAKLSATFEEPPAPAEEAAQEAEAEPDGEEGDDVEEEPAAPEGPTPDEVRAEVETFNATHASWAYALPSYKLTLLEKRVDDLLAPLPPPTEEEPPAEEESPVETGDTDTPAGSE